MPFGVDLPDNFGAGGLSTAPEQTPTGSMAPESQRTDSLAPPPPEKISPEPSRTQTTNTPGTPAQLLELDKHDRFRFKGQDWTREEFEKGYLRQQDYSKKTAELTEKSRAVEGQKAFFDNYSTDLEKIKADPDKWLPIMERVYPKYFVDHAKLVVDAIRRGASSPQNTQSTDPKTLSLKDHPDFKAAMERIERWEAEQAEAQAKTNRAWLDNQHETLGKKYPHAHPRLVENEVSAWLHKNNYGGDKVTANVMEQFYKAVDDAEKNRWAGVQKEKITKQIDVWRNARDVGPGGEPPSNAPRRPKTMKEAEQAMLDDAKNGTLVMSR